MKKTIIFLIVTGLLIYGIDLYFEYCVNRELPMWASALSTLGVIIVVLFYVKYLIRYIQYLLKL